MKKSKKIFGVMSMVVIILSFITNIFLQKEIIFADNLKNYANIEPKYITDDKGTFPAHSWIPQDNTNVLNHQGNIANQWDDLTSWNGNPENIESSYIEYGGVENQTDFAIRKYARETSTPGLFDVFLNVRGNVQNPIEPIDLTLVVDMSGSMKGEREAAVKKGIKDSLAAIHSTPYAEYVRVGLVGYSSPGYSTGEEGYIAVPLDNLANKDHIDEINNTLLPEFSGATFTQLGVRKGAEMLQNDSNNHQKIMILMTDGVPTVSYKVKSASISDGIIYGETFDGVKVDNPGDTSHIGEKNYYKINNKIEIKDTWAATLGEAKICKEDSIELHTLGIQLGNDKNYLDKESVRKQTSLLATTGLYHDAETATDITEYLNKQTENILNRFNTITNGFISDPLGAQFIYDNSPIEVKSVGANEITNLPKIKRFEEKLEFTNLNIGENQEVQIHYQVRINSESDNFIPEKWYQINGRTILTPNGNNLENTVDFGIPSAKGEAKKLTFNKIWEEYDKDVLDRPKNVTYEITRNDVSLGWNKGYIDISGENDENLWTKETSYAFTRESDKLYMAKYNIMGDEIKYNVSNEVSVPGYDSTQVDDVTFKNIKQFVPMTLELTKENSFGEKLTGAEFKLVDKDGKEITSVTDSSGSLFTFENLGIGKYILKEVNPPIGYQKLDENIEFEILENGQVKSKNIEIQIENNTIKMVIENQRKESKIELKKLVNKNNAHNNEQLVYTIMVKNIGDIKWEGTIIDKLPSEYIDYVQGSTKINEKTILDNQVIWEENSLVHKNTIAPGEELRISFKASIKKESEGKIIKNIVNAVPENKDDYPTLTAFAETEVSLNSTISSIYDKEEHEGSVLPKVGDAKVIILILLGIALIILVGGVLIIKFKKYIK
ncbi:SpaA isopeptide-forming pilin-related protein [Lactococcus garvieae]|uniref:VWA domain-containing protein n=1 Tax=Lactococcus garvieae TaxID=1363 RepID=UPI001F6051B3|nr:VWA domain-containing protein [Lactococcus garvieae]MCI3860722.1 VWA domain-containing protein [Lactococcus garvieae]